MSIRRFLLENNKYGVEANSNYYVIFRSASKNKGQEDLAIIDNSIFSSSHPIYFTLFFPALRIYLRTIFAISYGQRKYDF